MKERKMDYVISFLICIILNIIFFELPFNIISILEIILGSCLFGLIFGKTTNIFLEKENKLKYFRYL